MITLNNADERAEWKLHRARYLDDARHLREAAVMREASDYADAAIAEYRERLPRRATAPAVDPPPSPGPRPVRDDGTVVAGPCECSGAEIDYTPEGAMCTQCGLEWWT